MRNTILAAALIAASAFGATAAQACDSTSSTQVVSMSHTKMVITHMVDPADDPSYSWYRGAVVTPTATKQFASRRED